VELYSLFVVGMGYSRYDGSLVTYFIRVSGGEDVIPSNTVFIPVLVLGFDESNVRDMLFLYSVLLEKKIRVFKECERDVFTGRRRYFLVVPVTIEKMDEILETVGSNKILFSETRF
jgi:hypothetical protein